MTTNRTRHRRANVEVEDGMNLQELAARLRGLTEIEAHVGMQGDAELAMIAGVHEYGSVKMKIPARSFIGSGKKKSQTAIGKIVRKELKEVALGHRDPESLLKELGETGLDRTAKNFDRIRQPGLSPVYAHSKTGKKLLQRETDLRKSLTYKIVPRG